MAWLAVHSNGEEGIFRCKPVREDGCWLDLVKGDKIYYDTEIFLPKGTIKKILGRDLTWEDEPVELKEDTVEKITIDMEDYRRYLSYANYIQNWAPGAYKCPKCGALNPRGYICMECRYDGTR